MRSSSQTVDLFWLIFESAGVTRGNRAGLRVAITETIGATEALAGRASHDLDDNRRHTALHRARFGHRNFFRLHAALPVENAIIHRGRMDVSVQQNCSGHCRHTPRRDHLRHARCLFRRV